MQFHYLVRAYKYENCFPEHQLMYLNHEFSKLTLHAVSHIFLSVAATFKHDPLGWKGSL